MQGGSAKPKLKLERDGSGTQPTRLVNLSEGPSAVEALFSSSLFGAELQHANLHQSAETLTALDPIALQYCGQYAMRSSYVRSLLLATPQESSQEIVRKRRLIGLRSCHILARDKSAASASATEGRVGCHE